jgi:hypothetical protein
MVALMSTCKYGVYYILEVLLRNVCQLVESVKANLIRGTTALLHCQRNALVTVQLI